MSSQARKVFILPGSDNGSYNILRLKHPKTNTVALCALSESNKLFEIVHHRDSYSSWFIGESVIEDGSLYFVSPVDPLFFILPYIDSSGRYCRLQDILIDSDYPDTHFLEKCCSTTELLNVFDSKESSGFTVLCYNKSKALDWLQKKVNHLSSFLQSKGVSMSDGSVSASLSIDSENLNPVMWKTHACHLVADYLSEELSQDLFDSLGLERKTEKLKTEKPEEKSKKQKMSVSPTEDYSKNYSHSNSQQKQKNKLTPAQKRLQQTDKTGMKSISSFFMKK